MIREILNGFPQYLIFSPHEILRAIVLITLLAFCSSSSANEPFDDFRLFFPLNRNLNEHEGTTIQRRAPSTVKPTIIDVSKEDLTLETPSLMVKSPTVKSSGRPVSFNAFVRKKYNILLLVNDLPCRVVFDDRVEKIQKYTKVVCSHVERNQYSFKINPDEQALLVYQHKKYIATLFVGQGI